MEIIFKLVQIFICVLEAYLAVDFFSAFFRLRELFERKWTRLVLILGISICVYIINLQNSTTLNIITMQVIYISIILIFYQGKLLKKFICYITVTAIMVGSEFLGIILLSLQTKFVFSEVQSEQITVSVLTFIVKLLALVLLRIVKRIARGSNDSGMSLKITLLYSIMPISLIGIMIAITRFNINFVSLGFTHILLIISCIMALAGSVVIFYVFDRYALFAEKLKQQEIMIAKLEMEERHYGQIEQVNREHAAFLHDVRHYMKVIGEMATENNDRAILQILSELQIKVSDTELEMICYNRLLNAILNEKKKDAERKSISVKIVVEPDFSIKQVSDTDLIVIISNLLDNAVDAAEKCHEGYVKVYLFTRNDNHFSIIKIVNNYVGEIDLEDGRLVTGKQDKRGHGYGIQNVNDIAIKYGGYLQYFYEMGEFTSVVILPVMMV